MVSTQYQTDQARQTREASQARGQTDSVYSAEQAWEAYLFGSTVVKILPARQVWRITPHGQTLGEGMSSARHALMGKRAIEIGVGAGVHAIAALKLGVHVLDGTDIEPAALRATAANAKSNKVQLRNLWNHDWLDFEPIEPYDLMLCNPPFCRAGTADRRSFIDRLIEQSPRFLKPGGHLLFVQSSMADFARSEQALEAAGYYASVVHQTRGLFRDYYFEEPNFIEQSREVAGGFEEIDGCLIETLRVYLGTKRA